MAHLLERHARKDGIALQNGLEDRPYLRQEDRIARAGAERFDIISQLDGDIDSDFDVYRPNAT